jgi:hypothetical protein
MIKRGRELPPGEKASIPALTSKKFAQQTKSFGEDHPGTGLEKVSGLFTAIVTEG